MSKNHMTQKEMRRIKEEGKGEEKREGSKADAFGIDDFDKEIAVMRAMAVGRQSGEEDRACQHDRERKRGR